MEAQRRRLSALSSHLRPSPSTSFPPPPSVSGSDCATAVADHDHARREPSSEKPNPKSGCVFCEIVRGESPALKLYEDDMCVCILDTNPLSNGHSLVIPKSHFSSLETTPPPVVGAMCSKIPFISNAIMKATGNDSFNLLVNNGAAAGQIIFHTHIHIIPRKAYDSLWDSEGLRRHPLIHHEASQLVYRVQELLSLPVLSENGNSQGSCLSGNQ